MYMHTHIRVGDKGFLIHLCYRIDYLLLVPSSFQSFLFILNYFTCFFHVPSGGKWELSATFAPNGFIFQ